jgi:coenzyme F420-reducing hydrogenase alpha subunit
MSDQTGNMPTGDSLEVELRKIKTNNHHLVNDLRTLDPKLSGKVQITESKTSLGTFQVRLRLASGTPFDTSWTVEVPEDQKLRAFQQINHILRSIILQLLTIGDFMGWERPTNV